MSSTSALRQVFVGGYTKDAVGTADGLTSLLNVGSRRSTVDLEPRTVVPLSSPTWIARHPRQPLLVVAGESDPGTLTSLRYHDDGSVILLSTVQTGGDGACHVTVTADGRYALVSHYVSGSVATFEISETGILSEVVDVLELVGSGPDPERQEGPHAHQVTAVDDTYLICDLGGDQIFQVTLIDGALVPAGDPLELPPGSGPRHLVAVGDHLVVACELSGELWVGRRDGDGWEHRQTVPTSGRTGLVQPSGIITDGTRVFVANRGVDTVGVFDLDPASGKLLAVTEFDCGGHWPRALTLDGGRLWVCNERSSQVSIFEVSPLPSSRPAIELDLPTPTCVVLVHEEPAP